MWNAALMHSYTKPITGREAKAMEVFADALTLYGKLAADGRCAEPEVFHHFVGGGMFIVKTETLEIAHEILDMDDIRKMLDTAMFTVEDFKVEIMVTGEQLMNNMSLYTAIGTELGYI
ncbi:MAG: hypothetical protein QNJ77_02705 [Acidimicrobiia bacterium]|nr:hypothetical protein [Acidimicrobiia bacterium]